LLDQIVAPKIHHLLPVMRMSLGDGKVIAMDLQPQTQLSV